jgi:hypothetical protein
MNRFFFLYANKKSNASVRSTEDAALREVTESSLLASWRWRRRATWFLFVARLGIVASAINHAW